MRLICKFNDGLCCYIDKFYYRTMDGSCNWPKDGEAEYGKVGNAFSRDVPFTYYDDGVRYIQLKFSKVVHVEIISARG